MTFQRKYQGNRGKIVQLIVFDYCFGSATEQIQSLTYFWGSIINKALMAKKPETEIKLEGKTLVGIN